MTTTYQYGAFVLNDGVNYFLTEKHLDMPAFRQTLFPIARLEGMKKTGERINEKRIPVVITVVGVSRSDLESKLDTLYGALALRQQSLTLHALDNRYYVADAISGTAHLVPGKILSAQVPVTFVAQQPFAYAPAQSIATTGSVTLTQVTGSTTNWQLAGGFNVGAGGGNYFARPTLQIYNLTPINQTNLTAALTSGNVYTTLSVSALPAAATTGQIFILVNASNVYQRVTLAANALLGATSLSVTSFTANANYPAPGTNCGLDTYFQGFVLNQQPDNQTLLTTAVPVVQNAPTGGVTIYCDPTAPSGYSVIPTGAPGLTPIAFSGSFPVIEPLSTTFTLTLTCSTAPTIQLTAIWTPRWLS